MKLLENILLAFCVASLAIGVHQLYYKEVQEVYWILSLSVFLFLIYTWVKSKNTEKEKTQKEKENKNKSKEKIKKQYIDKESSNYTPPKKKRKK
jgi:Ca2+/Na+ antiporter